MTLYHLHAEVNAAKIGNGTFGECLRCHLIFCLDHSDITDLLRNPKPLTVH